ncbi:MAG TPA: hypothetical protein VMN57_12810 [Anaerolineales bacterium]|nr:hypothetical protein [Anaerolineales bacterium]
MIFLAALRKECLELWRTSRLVVLGVVLVLFGLTSPLIAAAVIGAWLVFEKQEL